MSISECPASDDGRTRPPPKSDPLGFTGASRPLKELTAAVDPTLQLYDLKTAADAERDARRIFGAVALAAVAVVLSVGCCRRPGSTR